MRKETEAQIAALFPVPFTPLRHDVADWLKARVAESPPHGEMSLVEGIAAELVERQPGVSAAPMSVLEALMRRPQGFTLT